MSGEADHSPRGVTCCPLASCKLQANSKSLDCEDRPLRARSSPLGMTEFFTPIASSLVRIDVAHTIQLPNLPKSDFAARSAILSSFYSSVSTASRGQSPYQHRRTIRNTPADDTCTAV